MGLKLSFHPQCLRSMGSLCITTQLCYLVITRNKPDKDFLLGGGWGLVFLPLTVTGVFGTTLSHTFGCSRWQMRAWIDGKPLREKNDSIREGRCVAGESLWPGAQEGCYDWEQNQSSPLGPLWCGRQAGEGKMYRWDLKVRAPLYTSPSVFHTSPDKSFFHPPALVAAVKDE